MLVKLDGQVRDNRGGSVANMGTQCTVHCPPCSTVHSALPTLLHSAQCTVHPALTMVACAVLWWALWCDTTVGSRHNGTGHLQGSHSPTWHRLLCTETAVIFLHRPARPCEGCSLARYSVTHGFPYSSSTYWELCNPLGFNLLAGEKHSHVKNTLFTTVKT